MQDDYLGFSRLLKSEKQVGNFGNNFHLVHLEDGAYINVQ